MVDTKTKIIYGPSTSTKIYIYVSTMILLLLTMYLAKQLYDTLINNYSVGIKIFFSYVLVFAIFAASIMLFYSSRVFLHFKYKVTMSEDNIITYEVSHCIVRQFAFSEIENIYENSTYQEFILTFKDGQSLILPFAIKDHVLFLVLLLNNYQPSFNINDLNKTYTRKMNKLVPIAIAVYTTPIFLVLAFVATYLVLFLIVAIVALFYFLKITKYITLSLNSIEIGFGTKKTTLSKTDITKIELERTHMRDSYDYSCLLSTKQNKTYKLTNFDISSINLYLLLMHWQKNGTNL